MPGIDLFARLISVVENRDSNGVRQDLLGGIGHVVVRELERL